jgi:tetraacyldisaccharide 4'-kinase
MQPPKFWYGAHDRDRAPVLQACLAPVSWAYAGASALKHATTTPAAVGAPVVCVGNLTVGGAGKTPVARVLRAMFLAQGIVAHIVSRGYGGHLRGPLRVDLQTHASSDVGDEPLLHATDGPAWIARDRVAGAQAAIGAGAPLILLDDGFQNPALRKDFSFVVIDADASFGNGRVFPAGPLREPLRTGLARANAVVMMGKGHVDLPFSGPVLRAHLAPLSAPPSGPLIAFAGIARPQKFFDTLTKAGGALIDGVAFPDHHAFTDADVATLIDYAKRSNAHLITTEKDFVRLKLQWREQIHVLPVTARFAAPDTLATLVAPLAAKANAAG